MQFVNSFFISICFFLLFLNNSTYSNDKYPIRKSYNDSLSYLSPYIDDLYISKILNSPEVLNNHSKDFLIKEELIKSWSNGDWNNDYKTEYSYDSKWNLLECKVTRWRYEAWQNVSKNNYVYDQYDALTESYYYSWNTVNLQWDQTCKYIYTFDLNKNLIEEREMQWTSISTQWENSYKRNFKYDTKKNILEEVDSNWAIPENFWKQDRKNAYEYNANNKIIIETFFDWEADSIWLQDYRMNYSYDTSTFLLTEYLGQKWENSQWVNSSKYNYSYNSDNVLVKQNTFLWFSDSSRWNDQWEYNYTYDINKNLIETIWLAKVFENGQYVWANNYKTTYTYINSLSINTNSINFKNNFTILSTRTGIFITTNNIKNPTLEIYTGSGKRIATIKGTIQKNGYLFPFNYNMVSNSFYIISIFNSNMKLIKKSTIVYIR